MFQRKATFSHSDLNCWELETLVCVGGRTVKSVERVQGRQIALISGEGICRREVANGRETKTP